MERSFNTALLTRRELAEWTRSILSRHGLRPRRVLSQNFIVDPNLIREMLNQVERGDDLLEIGCGVGTLTLALLSKARRILCVELDARLCDVARDVLRDPRVIVSNADAIRFPFTQRVLVSNTPYHITSDLLVKIARENNVEKAVLTLQAEVVDRLCAEPGSRDYGRITVLIKTLFKVEKGGVYPPRSFYPQPEVYNQVVVLRRREPYTERIQVLEEVTRRFFTQRRRIVDKVLLDVFGVRVESLGDVGREIAGRRVYSINPETWLKLADSLVERGVL